MMLLARLSTAREGDVLVVRISGEIDRSNRGELRQSILALVASDIEGVVIDLSVTSYLDSAGLDLLFDVQRRLQARGKRLALLVPDTAVIRRTLTVTGADRLIACADALPAAVTLTQSADSDL